MLFKQLFLAATAAAFLVVPEVSEVDKDTVNSLPIIEEEASILPAIATTQSIGVPCKQCKGKNTRVEMDFVVEDGSRLTLNGFELYPAADPWHDDLVASVVKGNGKSKEQRLGYSLSVKPDAVDLEQRLELVSIELRVIEVGSLFVDGMPTVRVRLIKAPSGEIIIGSVDVEETSEKDYENPLLRIKEKVKEFWSKIKGGCSRHRHSGAKQDGDTIMLEGQRPHGSHHHHGHHRHDWGKLLKNIAANILLPVLAGITAGVGVAVYVFSLTPSRFLKLTCAFNRLAMGLCSVFALVFRARRRRCRRAARLAKANLNEPAIAEEKAGLMESQDVPPEYEEEEQRK